MKMQIPIVIMSFDRPKYLERVLQTVVAQRPFRKREPVFYLLQDGSVSPRSGRVFGNQEKILCSREIFAQYLPQGLLYASEHNLGVAMNFDRAERLVFEEQGHDVAIFLEDDLLLQPNYFRIMEELLDIALQRDDIGMVSACGFRVSTPLAEQRRRKHEICLMDEHNWAFGLTRRAWRKRDTVLKPYLKRMCQIDYRDRDQGVDKQWIVALQKAHARHGQGYLSSQDSIKNLAMELLELHRISTFTNNARYIGKQGEHSTFEKFQKRGYETTVMFNDEHDGFDVPLPEDLRRMRLERHRR